MSNYNLSFSNAIRLIDVDAYEDILNLCKGYDNVEVSTLEEDQVNPAAYEDYVIPVTVDFENWKEQRREHDLARGAKEQRAYQRKEEGKSSDSD